MIPVSRNYVTKIPVPSKSSERIDNVVDSTVRKVLNANCLIRMEKNKKPKGPVRAVGALNVFPRSGSGTIKIETEQKNALPFTKDKDKDNGDNPGSARSTTSGKSSQKNHRNTNRSEVGEQLDLLDCQILHVQMTNVQLPPSCTTSSNSEVESTSSGFYSSSESGSVKGQIQLSDCESHSSNQHEDDRDHDHDNDQGSNHDEADNTVVASSCSNSGSVSLSTDTNKVTASTTSTTSSLPEENDEKGEESLDKIGNDSYPSLFESSYVPNAPKDFKGHGSKKPLEFEVYAASRSTHPSRLILTPERKTTVITDESLEGDAKVVTVLRKGSAPPKMRNKVDAPPNMRNKEAPPNMNKRITDEAKRKSQSLACIPFAGERDGREKREERSGGMRGSRVQGSVLPGEPSLLRRSSAFSFAASTHNLIPHQQPLLGGPTPHSQAQKRPGKWDAVMQGIMEGKKKAPAVNAREVKSKVFDRLSMASNNKASIRRQISDASTASEEHPPVGANPNVTLTAPISSRTRSKISKKKGTPEETTTKSKPRVPQSPVSTPVPTPTKGRKKGSGARLGPESGKTAKDEGLSATPATIKSEKPKKPPTKKEEAAVASSVKPLRDQNQRISTTKKEKETNNSLTTRTPARGSVGGNATIAAGKEALKEVGRLREELEALKASLILKDEALKANDETIQGKDKELEAAKRKIREQHVEEKKLRKKLDRGSEENSDLTRRLDAAEAKIRSLRDEQASDANRIRELESSEVSLSRSIEELRAQVEDSVANLERAHQLAIKRLKEIHQQEIAVYQNQKPSSTSTSTSEKLEKDMSSMNAVIEMHQAARRELQTKVDLYVLQEEDWMQTASQLRTAQSRVEDLEAQMSLHKEEKVALRLALSETESSLEAARGQIASLQKAIDELNYKISNPDLLLPASPSVLAFKEQQASSSHSSLNSSRD